MAMVDLAKLHTNQRLFVEELVRRGAKVDVVDLNIELLEVTFDSKTHYLLDRASSSVPYLPSSLTADKHITKHVLQKNGITAPKGRLFDNTQIDEALCYAEKLGFPLVLKPNTGSHGDTVHSGIATRPELEAALYAFLYQTNGQKYFIIEKHVPGKEFRIFITAKGNYAVLLREPASVIGDGKRTIKQLANQESTRRKKAKNKSASALCPIALDDVAQRHLRKNGLTFESVPAKGERIFLRLSSNLAQGGLSEDFTDRIHPSALAIAKKTLRAFDGLPCLGIDFLTQDITKPQTRGSYAIIEVNANPGISMHHFPAVGHPRNVASMLVDVMFPFIPSKHNKRS